MKITLIVVGIVVLACVVSSIPVNSPKEKARKFSMNKADIDNEWSYFKGNHSKTYKNKTEESQRRNLFEQSLKKINDQNEKYNNGTSTFTYGVTRFADMSEEEFMDFVKSSGLKIENTPNIEPETNLNIARQSLPSSIDWRTLGLVTPIKNQGSCGSCWAFSTQLVDCVYTRDGCQGGFMTTAFNYIVKAGGEALSTSYPYKSGSTGNWSGLCKYNSSVNGSAVKITGYKSITNGVANESLVTQGLANIGPLSVAVYVTSKFQLYTSGVFNDTTCPSGSINHAVNLVGYGTLSGQDYYILRNSWGTSWGQSGYMYFKRDTKGNANQCGIATYSYYPVISTTSSG